MASPLRACGSDVRIQKPIKARAWTLSFVAATPSAIVAHPRSCSKRAQDPLLNALPARVRIQLHKLDNPCHSPIPSASIVSPPVMRSSPSPHKRRAADPNACEGSVLVNFGGMHIYPMRSCLNPDLPATTLYITDVPDQLDLGFHPIHGQKGSPRVYRGWFYRAARDGASDEGEVAVKWVRGIRRIEALERERENYCRLLELQGVVIPHLWDYMEATIEGVDVACLVIEWCGEPHPEDPRLFSAQKLELAVLLHKEGWSHGDLLDVDSHHFVVAEDDETGNPLRLVDLTKASEHRCVFEDPECCMKPNPGGCRELDTLAAMRLLNL